MTARQNIVFNENGPEAHRKVMYVTWGL